MDPDSKELARCIHVKAGELLALIEQVKLKHPGRRGEKWADIHLPEIRRIIHQTKTEER